MAPRFSIICPTYNRSTAIEATIRSVQRQRPSPATSWELLVVSDGSTDDTDAVVAQMASDDQRIRLVRIARSGAPGAARNAGLALADGDFIAYLDHDDLFDAEHLATLSELLDSAEWAVTGATYVDIDGRTVGRTSDADALWSPDLAVAAPLFEPTRVGHRKDLLADHGIDGWTTDRRGLEDWDLWAQLADAGARPVPTTKRTVSLTSSATSRRHGMSWRFLHVVATCPDLRVAQAVLEALDTPEQADAVRRAAEDDLREWLTQLDEAGDLVRASDGQQDLDVLIAEIIAGAPPVTGGLQAVPYRGGAALAMPMACLRREHADRVGAGFTRRRRRQLAVIDGLVRSARAGDHGDERVPSLTAVGR